MFGPLLFAVVLAVVALLTLRRLHPSWWALRGVRFAALAVAASALLGTALRMLASGRLVSGFSHPLLSIAASMLGAAAGVLLFGSILSLPAAAILRAILRGVGARARAGAGASAGAGAGASAGAGAGENEKETRVTVPRRAVLEAVVASVPLATLGLAGVGIAGGFAATRLIRRPMRFANLAPELDGLKILQITDLHLGAFHSPSAIPALVELARSAEPDLLLFTGDICDHLPWLEDALHRFESIAPALGAFAVMGNHEHYRGALATRRIYGKTDIQMLDDRHHVLSVRGKRLLLVGVDDPSGWPRSPHHYEGRADKALASAPSDVDFRVALCHRPKGFRALAQRGVDLTLSGHTHGAQVGLQERSALESVAPDSYLWGRYEHEGKQLYTSSGAGHWAAFRLACPSEAPLIVLERG